MATNVLEHLAGRQAAMVDALGDLVRAESPSSDPAACAACGDVLSDFVAEVLGGVRPEKVVVEGRTHLRWCFGGPTRVAVIGHLDTVWPTGTLAELPFDVTDGIARGPGCFDMKAGLVQATYALASLDSLEGVTLLVTSDEELGSQTSRALIEETVLGARAALVAEPAVDGALKIARKGVSLYKLTVTGREAHAGLEPEKGANALLALADLLGAVSALAEPSLGTTVTPTVAAAGTARNVVPASAWAEIDVRASEPKEQSRIDTSIRGLKPWLPDTSVVAEGGPNRPPMPQAIADELFDRAQRVALGLGMPALTGQAVGGGSDGNFTAGVGVPTLDGLGAVGDGAHARHEHVVLSCMPERAALLGALIADLQSEPGT
ncbi:MAG TPA: M20/M25/M40 family metallo-hydrolase [Acidimicrobiales bacterium]|nr:M20/M25/M40 family metallo-hydrolase [Acidimicrobiales bacterium]